MKATEEIRMILDGCKSGELDHEQEVYFCRTARCVAGWKATFDFEKEHGRYGTNEEVEDWAIKQVWGYNKEAEYGRLYNPTVWSYAEIAWGLPWDSSRVIDLFGSTATFEQQYEALARLEKEGY